MRMDAAGRREEAAPGAHAFVDHDRVVGEERADRLAERHRLDLAGRGLRRRVRRADERRRACADLVGQPFERVHGVLLARRHQMNFRARAR